ncbi:MAG: hypothetical protein AAF557_21720 [Pseudomonadota bacterium]
MIDDQCIGRPWRIKKCDMQIDDMELDAAAVVQQQDTCLNEDGIDCESWAKTVFLPLTLISENSSFHIRNNKGLFEHLKKLEKEAKKIGIAKLQTCIISQNQRGRDMSVVSSVRKLLSSEGLLIGSTSITWTLLKLENLWKINLILFNDSVFDRSVVARVF